jgi:hypothetical protein
VIGVSFKRHTFIPKEKQVILRNSKQTINKTVSREATVSLYHWTVLHTQNVKNDDDDILIADHSASAA